MEYAIAQLEVDLYVVENNAPIHEAEGKLKQAELERKVAASVRQAIEKLKENA
jgi:hypothetical protein